MGFPIAAVSLLLAAPAFAGIASLRLDGFYPMEDESEGDANEACFDAEDGFFGVFGHVVGTTPGCTIEIEYDSNDINKASGSVLKSDNEGTAKLSQQVQTRLDVTIVSGEGCAVPAFAGTAFPEKCKVSSSIKGTESPDVLESGKASLSCELGSDGSELSPSPTTAQVDEIIAAFADRKDVKVTDKGKLTIKTKGVPDAGSTVFCD
jgi:hypothetical protein